MQVNSTIRIALAVWLVLANAWCVIACSSLPCQPAAAVQKHSDPPPCHQAPQGDPDDAEPNCAHPIVAETLTAQSADVLSVALSFSVLPASLTLPLLQIAPYADHEPPGLAWRSPPSKTIVLRV